MKLQALRVCEVGPFSEPVALEGFSGDLDVLVGANEFGKSTLLRALKLVFSEKFSSNRKNTVGVLKPYGGGAPLIEVDFSVGPARWRLTKRYLSQNSARLVDLDGHEIVRGKDVEPRLHDILHDGGRDVAPLNLFWLDQKAAFEGAPIDGQDQLRLRDIIGREVSTVVAGSDTLARVREELKSQLDELATPGNRKPKGAWAKAIKDCDASKNNLARAQERLREAQKRLQKLSAIDQRIASLTKPEAQQDLYDRHEVAKNQLQQVEKAREKLKSAQLDYQSQTKVLESAEAAKSEFEKKRKTLDSLNSEIKTAQACLDNASKTAATEKSNLEAAVQSHDSLTQQLSSTRALQGYLSHFANFEHEQKRLNELADKMQAIEKLSVDLANKQKELTGNRATATAIMTLKETIASIENTKERLSAAAPEISIDYQPSVDLRLTIDKRKLEDGEKLRIARSTVLDIPGIGALTIVPGGSEDVQGDREDLAALEETHDEILRKIGVSKVALAFEQGTARQALVEAGKDIENRLFALAPNGTDAVRDEVAELSARVGKLKRRVDELKPAALEGARQTSAELPTIDDVNAKLAALDSQMASAADTLKNVRAKAHAADGLVVQLSTQLQELHKQLKQQNVDVPEAAKCEAQLKDMQETIVAHENSVSAALQKLVAIREAAGDEDRFLDAKSAFDKVEASVRGVKQELNDLRLDKKGLEGELQASEQHGIGAHVQDCSDRYEYAQTRLRRIEDDVAALSMLLDEMAIVELESRDRFLQPVLQGMRPYLDQLFPDARIEFSADLSLAKITRQKVPEKFANVSDGTREQLAILARLGFGRVFADAGHPLPLVLDDPLASADDERLEKMFAALQEAAKRHQVIVFSCHEQAFNRLIGHQLNLTSWKPSETETV
ncbi:MAG: AAA family ATPase [Hyphomicrobiaceae bacterium]